VPDLSDATIHAGLDVGRTSDLTALTILAVVDEHAYVLAVLTCQRSRFAEQRAMLDAARARFQWDSLTVDATGLGTQLAEELAEEWGDEVRPLVFSARVKEDLATRTFRWLAGRRLHLPVGDAGRALRGEALALQRIVTDAGTVTYSSPRGAAGHGDRLTSLTLALRGAGEPSEPVRMGQRPLFAVA
jgi:phage FluMu gp28-like protein